MIPQKLSMSLGEMESEIGSHLGPGEIKAVKRSKIKVEVFFSLISRANFSNFEKCGCKGRETTAHMSVFRKRGKVNNNNTQVTYR